jgi:hypothetical protein
MLIKEWRLVQRTVFVIDGQARIVHAEYVEDPMREPDYEAALPAALRSPSDRSSVPLCSVAPRAAQRPSSGVR